jgi:hypothetical protein
MKLVHSAQSVSDENFKKYGTIHLGYDITEFFEPANKFELDGDGSHYRASVPEFEQTDTFKQFKNIYAGGQDVECGICWGYNDLFNGVEYHRSSEVIIPLDDVVIILGDRRDIKDNTYESEKAEFFFVPKGTVVELYATTLHLAPCTTKPQGFRVIVILPRGTNAPLTQQEKDSVLIASGEYRLLGARDKWMIMHPETDACTNRNAFPGIKGDNYRYIAGSH